jgi:vacuolar-type H+-ATPase subunit H
MRTGRRHLILCAAGNIEGFTRKIEQSDFDIGGAAVVVNIEDVITRIEEEIHGSRKIGRTRMLDADTMQELLESLRTAMPNVIERAKEVVADRAKILDEARHQGETVIAEANGRAGTLETHANTRVQELITRARETVNRCRMEGEQIIAAAQSQAAELVAEHNISVRAEKKAEETVRQANQDADEIVQVGRIRAEEIVAQAERYTTDLQEKTTQWVGQYVGAVRAKSEEMLDQTQTQLSDCLAQFGEIKQVALTRLDAAIAAPDFNRSA